ncbi:MAG: sigma-70 family RNA polymerase sigma factor, partial [Verrucomicrobiales bacterium]|nr:sigma-70 family RNA polymerase sigma factor [Verrucomicrobiales bacterium]
MSVTDLELLRRYAADGCEEAFAELVRRHLDLVFGVALRVLRHRQWAEEVAQSVFLDLARQARGLAATTVLPAWLHEVARRTAIDLLRREQRRMTRERTAMEQSSTEPHTAGTELEPILDDGLAALGDRDRTLLVLRYLQGRSIRDVGGVLGINEDAAQKGISRAVDRLRAILVRKGVGVGAAGLAAAMSVSTGSGAPPALAQAIAVQATAIAAESAVGAGWLSVVAVNAPGKAVLAAALAVAVLTASYQTFRASQLGRLVRQIEESEARAVRGSHEAKALAEGLQQEILGLRARNGDWERDRLDLLRLRNEVGELRAKARARPAPSMVASGSLDPAEAALKSWAERVKHYKALAGRMPDKAIPELKLLTEEDWIELTKEPLGHSPNELDLEDPKVARLALSAARAKAKDRLKWVFSRALRGYADAHDGRLPGEVAELQPYLMHTHVVGPARSVEIAAGSVGEEILSRYRMMATGNLADQPAEQAVLTEVAPVDTEFDTCLRVGNYWVAVGGLQDFPAP